MPTPARDGKRGQTTLGRTDKRKVRAVASDAAAYFRAEGRIFPWRVERNPYRLAIAEILLQKTRAFSVVSTYAALLSAYPDPASLANADVHDIEARLRPLGLSTKRAAQLVAMASAVLEFGDTIFEDWRTLLRDVPGLGAYAARAIASFGRGEPVGIVDANVARILRRVFRIVTQDARAVVYQQYADAIAEASAGPRETNFGLLDIGATICLPRPRCAVCPFSMYCARFGVSGSS